MNILQCNNNPAFGAGAVATFATAFFQPTSVGSLLFATFTWEVGTTITSVTGTGGMETWTACDAALTVTGSSHQTQAFYCLSAAGGAETVTAHFSGGGGTYVCSSICEYGFNVTGLGQTAQTTNTGTTATSPSITPLVQSIVIGYVGAGASGIWNAGTGYVARVVGPPSSTFVWSGLEDTIASAGAIAASFTASSGTAAWVCGVAAFPLAVPPAPSAGQQQIFV